MLRAPAVTDSAVVSLAVDGSRRQEYAMPAGRSMPIRRDQRRACDDAKADHEELL